MKKTGGWFVVVAGLVWCVVGTAAQGVDSRGMRCLGGTAADLPKDTQGNLNATGPTALTFRTVKGIVFELPYDRITSLEYGSKSHAKIAEAILISPWFLASKTRSTHFLTIYYTDTAGQEQASLWQVGDDVADNLLMNLQLKTKKKVTHTGER